LVGLVGFNVLAGFLLILSHVHPCGSLEDIGDVSQLLIGVRVPNLHPTSEVDGLIRLEAVFIKVELTLVNFESEHSASISQVILNVVVHEI